jgi:hypothetical protein
MAMWVKTSDSTSDSTFTPFSYASAASASDFTGIYTSGKLYVYRGSAVTTSPPVALADGRWGTTLPSPGTVNTGAIPSTAAVVAISTSGSMAS